MQYICIKYASMQYIDALYIYIFIFAYGLFLFGLAKIQGAAQGATLMAVRCIWISSCAPAGWAAGLSGERSCRCTSRGLAGGREAVLACAFFWTCFSCCPRDARCHGCCSEPISCKTLFFLGHLSRTPVASC